MLELISALFKTGTATVANLLINAFTVKIIAIMTGPSGVGVWSLLRQSQQVAVMVGTGNGGASLVRGISQLPEEERPQFMRTVAFTYLVLGALVTLGMVLLAAELSSLIGGISARIFGLLALPVAIGILRDYLVSLLNGMQAIGRLALIQIVGPLAVLCVAYPVGLLVSHGDYAGFVLLMFVNGLVSSIAAIAFIRRSKWKIGLASAPYWTEAGLRRFAGLAGVMMVTGVSSMLTLLVVRVLIVRYRGIDEAGYFDVAWSLGLMYIGVLLSTLSTFYMPRLAAMAGEEQVELIQHVAKLTVIIMTPLIVLVTVIKPWIVSILYSHDFLPALGMFQYLLIADYFKMSTYVFSIMALARGLDKSLLLGSLLWDAGLLGGVWATLAMAWPSEYIGLVVVLLHLLSLVGYARLIRKNFPIRFSARLGLAWFAGLLCILGATVLTRDSSHLNLLSCCLPLLVALVISWTCLSRADVAALRRIVRVKLGK